VYPQDTLERIAAALEQTNDKLAALLTLLSSTNPQPHTPARAAVHNARTIELPDEVSTEEAAHLLGTTKHTVLKYLQDGLLEWRNAAPKSSHRPVYRLTLRSVENLRASYRRGQNRPEAQPLKQRRKPRPGSVRVPYQAKHIRREEIN
jgi:hypothetical protein